MAARDEMISHAVNDRRHAGRGRLLLVIRTTLLGLSFAGLTASFAVALLLAGMRWRSDFEVNVGSEHLRVGCASSGNSSKFYIEHDGIGIRYPMLLWHVWDDSLNDSARHGLPGFAYGTGVWTDGGYEQMVKVPIWFPATGTGIALAWACLHVRRRRRAMRAGLCARCGYDLRASPYRCPECGSSITPSP